MSTKRKNEGVAKGKAKAKAKIAPVAEPPPTTSNAMNAELHARRGDGLIKEHFGMEIIQGHPRCGGLPAYDAKVASERLGKY